MFKALAARLGINRSVLSNPLGEDGSRDRPPTSGPAASAGLSAEDDFEIGGEFLDVFIRASERAAGFVAGCTVIGLAWALFSLL